MWCLLADKYRQQFIGKHPEREKDFPYATCESGKVFMKQSEQIHEMDNYHFNKDNVSYHAFDGKVPRSLQ